MLFARALVSIFLPSYIHIALKDATSALGSTAKRSQSSLTDNRQSAHPKQTHVSILPAACAARSPPSAAPPWCPASSSRLLVVPSSSPRTISSPARSPADTEQQPSSTAISAEKMPVPKKTSSTKSTRRDWSFIGRAWRVRVPPDLWGERQ